MARNNTIFAFLLGVALTATGLAVYWSQSGSDSGEQFAAQPALFPTSPMPYSVPELSTTQSQAGLDDVPTMIRRLAQRLEQNPDNPDGWRMLGWSYFATGQAKEAVKAYAKAIALKGDVAEYHSAYGEALVKVADGIVTPDAKAAFDSALAINSDDAQAKYFGGLWTMQSGDSAGAYNLWKSLMKSAPPDASFMQDLRADMASLSRKLGKDAPVDLPTDPPAEPITGAAETSTAMPGEQMKRIRGMVEGLAQRLKDAPDDADGWRMLGKSYGVLGNYQGSIQAYARLVTLRPDDPSARRRHAEAVLATVSSGDRYPSSLSESLIWLYRSNPKDEFALFHLGESYSRAGKKKLALRYWRSLLEVLPRNSSMRETVGLRLRTVTEIGTR